jgi:hypothetical protein
MAIQPPRRPVDPDAGVLRARLNAAHAVLLRVHKTLVDNERVRYERAQRPLGTPLEFLQLLLKDPRFAWLRPVSELIVQIDEAASSREPIDPGQAMALIVQARALLTPDESATGFPQQYHHAIQESPEVAAAHAEWKRFAAADLG